MNSSSSASVRWRFVAPALALSLTGLALGGCLRTIKSDELGVLRTFGVVRPSPLSPGLHVIAPWQSLEPVTMAFTDLNFTQSDSSEEATISALTRDGVTIDVPVTVSWAIDPATLTKVKARLPGYYTDREYVIVRSAVRDAIQSFAISDGRALDRGALTAAVDGAIKKQTISYYMAQGFGSDASHIVRYGLITLRGVWAPEEITKQNERIIAGRLEAIAAAARTVVPDGRAVRDYTAVLQSQAVAKAAADGKANVTIVSGGQSVVAVAPK